MRGSRQFECGRLYSPLNLALYPLLHVSVAFHPRDRGLHPHRLRPTVQAGKKQTTRFQNRLETRERLVQLASANMKKAEGTTLSLDPHKWLYQPIDCGCLLYRDAGVARKTFNFSGGYAKQLSSDPIEGFAFFEESMELSRRFRALKLWLSLRYHGLQSFRAAIQQDLDHAQRLVAAIKDSPALEIAGPAELSTVCFRHRVKEDASEEARNLFNLAFLKRIVSRGKVYLPNAELKGKFCLRVCTVNHLTMDKDIDAVVPEVLAAASEIMSEYQ